MILSTSSQRVTITNLSTEINTRPPAIAFGDFRKTHIHDKTQDVGVI